MTAPTSRNLVTSLASAVTAALFIGIGTAAAQPEATLNKCQHTAGKEVGKYAAAVQKNAAKCLNKISTARIEDALADAADAAGACASALRKLVNTEAPTKTLAAKAEAKIEKICDPAAVDSGALHTVADVLGTGATVLGDPIGAEDLGAWCTRFGGDGGVDSIQEWVDCQIEAASLAAIQQLPAEYPNALAWLADVRGDIVALGPDQKYVDAVAALDALVAALDGDGDDDFDLGGVLLATGQTLSFGSGTDGDLQTGLARSFIDNGDGTITDTVTGLMWEKKHDTGAPFADCTDEVTGTCGNPHDVDNRYEWCADDAPENASCDNPGFLFDGPIVTIFLEQLNNRCNDDVTVACTIDSDCAVPGGPCGFAGHRDWRVPNLFELESLRNLAAAAPTVHSAFHTGCAAACALTTPGSCSCTQTGLYYSSTSRAIAIDAAWGVAFQFGESEESTKPFGNYVRAVRGGL